MRKLAIIILIFLGSACFADGHCAARNLILESYIYDPCLKTSGYCFKAGNRLYQSANSDFTIVGWDITQRAKPVKIFQWTDANYGGWEGITGTQDYIYRNYGADFAVGDIRNLSVPALLSQNAYWQSMGNTCEMLHYPDVMVAKKASGATYMGGFSIVNVSDGNLPIKTYDMNDANMQKSSGWRFYEDNSGDYAVVGGENTVGLKYGSFGTLNILKFDWQTETASKVGYYMGGDSNTADGWFEVKYTDVTPDHKTTIMTDISKHKLIFMNTKDFNNPSFVRTYTNTTYFSQVALDPYCVHIVDNLAFVNGNIPSSIVTFEISDPNNPIVVGYIVNTTWLQFVDDMRDADGHLYCTINYGLSVFKIPNFQDRRQRQ